MSSRDEQDGPPTPKVPTQPPPHVTRPTPEALSASRREPTWADETASGPNTSPDRIPAPNVPRHLGYIPEPSTGPRVLIVDDKADMRLGLRSALEDADEGYIIEEAENGLECFQMIAKMWPDIDLILLDLMMPVINGFQVMSVTMAFRGCISDVPIIAISGQPDLEDELPEDDRVLFLRKGSFNGDRLRDIVRRAVAEGRERRVTNRR